MSSLNAPRFLDIRGVREYLDNAVSIPTVYRLLARGEIPNVRIGDRRLVRLEDLESYIDRQTEGKR